jgi:hypothetical protein
VSNFGYKVGAKIAIGCARMDLLFCGIIRGFGMVIRMIGNDVVRIKRELRQPNGCQQYP